MLSLDQIWRLMPASRLSQLPFQSMITQFEHPLLLKPYFAGEHVSEGEMIRKSNSYLYFLLVHPCHTKTLMKDAYQIFSQIHRQNSSKKFNYILSWLSCVGPMAGLRLDLELVKLFS